MLICVCVCVCVFMSKLHAIIEQRTICLVIVIIKAINKIPVSFHQNLILEKITAIILSHYAVCREAGIVKTKCYHLIYAIIIPCTMLPCVCTLSYQFVCARVLLVVLEVVSVVSCCVCVCV